MKYTPPLDLQCHSLPHTFSMFMFAGTVLTKNLAQKSRKRKSKYKHKRTRLSQSGILGGLLDLEGRVEREKKKHPSYGETAHYTPHLVSIFITTPSNSVGTLRDAHVIRSTVIRTTITYPPFSARFHPTADVNPFLSHSSPPSFINF